MSCVPIATAIRAILDRHDPYPGLALDASGKVHMTNKAYDRLVPQAMERTPEENLDRFYGPGGMSEKCENWSEVAWAISDLRSAQARRSGDPELLRLAKRAREHLRDVPRTTSDGEASPVICSRYRIGGETFATFTSVLRFETAREVTLSELRIELIFPADEHTGDLLRLLAAG